MANPAAHALLSVGRVKLRTAVPLLVLLLGGCEASEPTPTGDDDCRAGDPSCNPPETPPCPPEESPCLTGDDLPTAPDDGGMAAPTTPPPPPGREAEGPPVTRDETTDHEFVESSCVADAPCIDLTDDTFYFERFEEFIDYVRGVTDFSAFAGARLESHGVPLCARAAPLSLDLGENEMVETIGCTTGGLHRLDPVEIQTGVKGEEQLQFVPPGRPRPRTGQCLPGWPCCLHGEVWASMSYTLYQASRASYPHDLVTVACCESGGGEGNEPARCSAADPYTFDTRLFRPQPASNR